MIQSDIVFCPPNYYTHPTFISTSSNNYYASEYSGFLSKKINVTD